MNGIYIKLNGILFNLSKARIINEVEGGLYIDGTQIQHPNPRSVINRISKELECVDLDVQREVEVKNKTDNMTYEKFLREVDNMGYTVRITKEEISVMANLDELAVVSIVKPYKYEVFDDKLESLCYQLAVVELDKRGMIN